jgi:ketosteroid isomerase-like protein
MKMLYSVIMALLLASANATTEPIESEVWINNKSLEMAINSGDTSALAGLYAKDAFVVPPSLEILNAQDEIRNNWVSQKLIGTENFQVQTVNLRLHDDLIYQTAVWFATVTENGIAIELGGEMTNVIGRQDDGSWKIKLQSWN